MKRFVEGYRSEKMFSGEFTIPPSVCYTDGVRLHAPLNEVSFEMSDDAYAVRAMVGMKTGSNAALGIQLNVTDGHCVMFETINTSTAGAETALRNAEERRRIHAVGGVVTEDLLDDESVVFVDPQNLCPHLNKFRRHVIHLSPTLEQEFFVLAQYLGSTTGANAHAVIRSDEGAAMADVLRRSLVTFGGSLLSSTLLAGGDALESHLPRDGDVFVVGLAAADVSVIERHLAEHSGVRVFVLFTDLSLFYDEFVAAFNGSGDAGRLVFATSLPHWADINTTSETVQLFHAAVEEKAKWTPLALRAFASSRLMLTVLSHMDKVSADLFADFFYKNVALAAEDMLYGTFIDSSKCSEQREVNAIACAVNYGATRISVWSMARVLDPAVPELFPAVTPSMEYTDPDDGRLALGLLLGIIVVSISGGILLAALFALLCCAVVGIPVTTATPRRSPQTP
ncbi:adenylyl cyclase [Trypanosoma grayi]|uniref:adenylyl cyclase n=1 Tax=Trypanosoma grayi TaxID=71804 RepID=UPI0004F44A59|nr:adenylyl cyclase [Trypanosoma grayi]KEG05757.1 adenylyl cyclase [Trypanosoma grayi]